MASAKRRLERPVWAIHEDAMDIDSDVQAMEEDMAQMAFSEREPIRRGVPPGHRDLTLQALSLFDQRPGDEEEEDQKQPSSLRRGRDDDDEEPQRPAQRLRRNSPPPPLLARRLERDAAEAAEWERPKEQVRRLRAEPRSEEDPFSQLYEDDQLRNDFHLGEDWGGMVDHMDIADIENRVVSDRFRLAFRVCLDLCGRIEATKTIPQLVQELDAFRRTRGIPQYDPYRELAAPGDARITEAMNRWVPPSMHLSMFGSELLQSLFALVWPGVDHLTLLTRAYHRSFHSSRVLRLLWIRIPVEERIRYLEPIRTLIYRDVQESHRGQLTPNVYLSLFTLTRYIPPQPP